MVEVIQETKGFKLLINGIQIPGSFTLETGKIAVERFAAICQRKEAELLPMIQEYIEKRNWNWNPKNKGRNWPIFNRMEKTLREIQKEAGIYDS